MPELPEVEVFRRLLRAKALRRRIVRVEVKTPRILAGIPAATFVERLVGHSLVGTRRHGKRLYARLDRDGFLALHFGMTGDLRCFTGADPEPAYDRVVIGFSDGRQLGYYNRRMIGRVGLVDDAGADIAEHELGPDALALDLEEFERRVGASRGRIKAVLTDQSVLAGIGNIYADEILFQARTHPQARASELDGATRRRLYRTMKSVLQKTIACGADPERLPKNFLIPRRKAGAACPRCGAKVARLALGGRSTYFCPRCQPKIRAPP